MPMTLCQKILAAKAGLPSVSPGQLITATLDLALANDITAPVSIKALRCAKVSCVAAPDKIALVLDHFAPNKDIQAATQCQMVREFANQQQIPHFFDVGTMGIEHALLPEQGLVAPGELIVGADSHTCTYGALGAFATGMGSTDLAYAFATGQCWFKVPHAIKVVLTGQPAPFVSGKDIILHIIGRIGVDGALYQTLEFCGDGVAHLTMDDRFTICNMAIEAGAKAGIFPVDGATLAYTEGRVKRPFTIFAADEDAVYTRTLAVDLSALRPTVACPHLPSNTHTADELAQANIRVDQVVIGSCTNGRIGDLRVAAQILRGKKVAQGVRVLIFPATQAIYLQALREGLLEDFVEAGAAVSTPTCGPCLGGHMGILAPGEVAVATTNRNFVGRMGHPTSQVYLASPAVAAATALTGSITSPAQLA